MLKSSYRLVAPVVVAVLATMAAGCGGKAAGPTGTVTGKIVFEGQPVTEGTVSFISEKGHGASGALGPEGQYTLKTVDSGAKVPAGDYQVSVQPPAAPPPDLSKPPSTKPGEVPGVPQIKEYPNIPSKYRNPATSGWKATVKEGENRFDFEMKKGSPEK